MLRYQRISVAFFPIKNLLNGKLLVTGCQSSVSLVSQSSVSQGSVLEFFPSLAQNSCVMLLSKDVKLVKGRLC